MRSELSHFEASLEGDSRQYFTFHGSFIAREADGDQSRDLLDAEAQKNQSFEVTLAEVQRRMDHYSSLYFPLTKSFVEASVRLQGYLQALFDAMCEPTVASPFASTGQEEMHAHSLCKSTRSIVLYLDRNLSSLASVSNSGSKTSSPVGPDGLSSM